MASMFICGSNSNRLALSQSYWVSHTSRGAMSLSNSSSPWLKLSGSCTNDDATTGSSTSAATGCPRSTENSHSTGPWTTATMTSRTTAVTPTPRRWRRNTQARATMTNNTVRIPLWRNNHSNERPAASRMGFHRSDQYSDCRAATCSSSPSTQRNAIVKATSFHRALAVGPTAGRRATSQAAPTARGGGTPSSMVRFAT